MTLASRFVFSFNGNSQPESFTPKAKAGKDRSILKPFIMQAKMPGPFIALGSRLCRCANVITLGVKPNFFDYSSKEQELIRTAKRIYYPSSFYSAIFAAAGKPSFPSPSNYRFALDKISQTALFLSLGIAHPRTRIYYGPRNHRQILKDFSLPLVAKIPRGSARGEGVFFIQTNRELADYCNKVHAAYIQEYIPADRDLRVLVIGSKAVISYWKIAKKGAFAANLSQGASISFDNIPQRAVNLAVDAANACGFDDTGLDVRMANNGPVILEANMKYGTLGLKAAGIDYFKLMEDLLENGKI
ncbi:MAG: RimK family alpha-L-glutamate ligase [Desulfatibacillaceae bacterium]|nr:RimK family alpha-L-glutamate ligase [Desulfatibacillaceae bacterium]